MSTRATDRRTKRVLVVLVALAVTTGVALAQPSSPPSSTEAPPGPPPPTAPTPPEKIAPSLGAPSIGQTARAGGRAASGVIAPPSGVDPGIRAAPSAPTAPTMPVIPPPGTQGGNPNVQPK
jgi:hypothetical protein